ncbi:MAG: glycosyltransferase family 9 protein [Acidobacteria bacterium]|nr:glycosyltransferase family 9 protein [Acidobacteriota bacterium]
MGDTVLTTPALALLHEARPDLEIFVAVERPWDRLLESNPALAGVIPFERGGRWNALAAVRRLHAPLCVNLHGGSTSAWLTALAGARWRAGFGHFAFQAVYNVRIPRAQEILGRASDAPVHTAEHLASAVFYLGVGQREIPGARLFAGDPPARPPYAVLHAAASDITKQWPAARFAELARRLRREQGLEPLLLAGPGEDGLLAGMKEFTTFDNLSLGEMMALLKGAELFVGNDSGPAHVAAAFGVPCVAIFGSSDSRVWYPWKTRRQVVESAGGIQAVEVEAVRQAVLAVLPARSVLQA